MLVHTPLLQVAVKQRCETSNVPRLVYRRQHIKVLKVNDEKRHNKLQLALSVHGALAPGLLPSGQQSYKEAQIPY
jgi:hypothetical protein